MGDADVGLALGQAVGDVQRATINWNLALRLDPEYTDVRNILKALHENNLKSASLLEE